MIYNSDVMNYDPEVIKKSSKIKKKSFKKIRKRKSKKRKTNKRKINKRKTNKLKTNKRKYRTPRRSKKIKKIYLGGGDKTEHERQELLKQASFNSTRKEATKVLVDEYGYDPKEVRDIMENVDEGDILSIAAETGYDVPESVALLKSVNWDFESALSKGVLRDSQVGAPTLPLPDGWIREVSRTSGETYYRNTVTDEAQWEFPTRAAQEPSVPEQLDDQGSPVSEPLDDQGSPVSEPSGEEPPVSEPSGEEPPVSEPLDDQEPPVSEPLDDQGSSGVDERVLLPRSRPAFLDQVSKLEPKKLKDSPEIQDENTKYCAFNFCWKIGKTPTKLAYTSIGKRAPHRPPKEGSYIAKFDNWCLWPQWETETEESYIKREKKWISLINYLRYGQSWKIFKILCNTRPSDYKSYSDMIHAANDDGDDDYYRLAFAEKSAIDYLIEEYEYIKVNLGDSKEIEITGKYKYAKVVPTVDGILKLSRCTDYILKDYNQAKTIGQIISDGLQTVRDDEPRLINRRIDWLIKRKNLNRELQQLREEDEKLRKEKKYEESKKLHEKYMEKHDEIDNYRHWTPESQLFKNMGNTANLIADKYKDSTVVDPKNGHQLVEFDGGQVDTLDRVVKHEIKMLTYQEFINLFSDYSFDLERHSDFFGDGRVFSSKYKGDGRGIQYNKNGKWAKDEDYKNLEINKTELESLPLDQIMRELTKAFRKKALKCHPDKIPKNVTLEEEEKLTDMFTTMKESYERLINFYEI